MKLPSQFEFNPDHYPSCPGCYIMRDRSGKVIYVGKSKNLRHRLTSYFREVPPHTKVAQIRALIGDLEVILVNTETESLLLENNLIKFYKPRFNSRNKPDNSGYYYIIQTGEAFPRFLPFRKNRISKQLERVQGLPIVHRFGPYVNKEYRDILLEFVCDSFQIKTCDFLPQKACLNAQLLTCSAPCEEKITPEDYYRHVERAVAFLSTPQPGRVEKMRHKMMDLAGILQFENAQRVKRQIDALEATLTPQCVEQDLVYNQDVIYFGLSNVLIAHIHQGMILTLELFSLPQNNSNPYLGFIRDHYSQSYPDEVIVISPAEDLNIRSFLTDTEYLPKELKITWENIPEGLADLCAMNYHYRVPEEVAH